MLETLEQLTAANTPLWLALVALGVSVIIIGVAKSGFGGGVGILAVPLTAAALNADTAVGVLLPLLIAGDMFAVWHHRKHADRSYLKPILSGAVVGIVLGTAVILLFQQADILIPAFNLTIGIICTGFVALQLYRQAGGHVPRVPNNPPMSVAAGGLCGFVSTLAHSAGPIMTIYFLEHRLNKRTMVGTLAISFFVINCMKLPSFFALKLITPQTLLLSGLAVILMPLGSLLGYRMHHRIPEKPFTLIMYVSAAAAGIWMIVKTVV